jgi:hypothetical protein
MRTSSTPRYGLSFSLMVAALVALAILSSGWGKGGDQKVADAPGIDVPALTSKAAATNLPVLNVDQPF